jgi:four helix bundle protein
MRPNIVLEKSFAFALQVVKLCRDLQLEQREYVLSKQLLWSGTAIGALVREAVHGESKHDFIHKMAIALKEANETGYWIELLGSSKLIDSNAYTALHGEAVQLIKLLTAIINSAKLHPHDRTHKDK